MKRFIKGLYIALMVMALVVPMVSFALPTPSLPVSGRALTLDEIEDRIVQVAQFLIVVSLIIAVVMIIWGAILFMLARGGDTKKAKATVTNGIIGAVIVLAVGVLLQTLAGLITRSFFN